MRPALALCFKACSHLQSPGARALAQLAIGIGLPAHIELLHLAVYPHLAHAILLVDRAAAELRSGPADFAGEAGRFIRQAVDVMQPGAFGQAGELIWREAAPDQLKPFKSRPPGALRTWRGDREPPARFYRALGLDVKLLNPRCAVSTSDTPAEPPARSVWPSAKAVGADRFDEIAAQKPFGLPISAPER